MMSHQKQTVIHPFIYFLIEDGFSAIFDQLKTRQTPDALRELYWLTSFLDQEGQEALESTTQKMEALLEDVNNLDRKKFREVLKEVTFYLHKQGYFINAKSEIPTRKVSFETLGRQLSGSE
jgi:hypothetical protein